MTAVRLKAPQRRFAMQLTGSAVVLGVLFWLMPLEAFFAAFERLTVRHFVLVLGGFLVLHVFAAMKWWVLLDRRIPFLLAVRAHFAGLAANLCLPGAIGGDAVRGGMAFAAMGDGATVFAVGATDRLVDFVALLILSLFGVALSVSIGGSLVLSAEVLVVFAGLVIAGGLGLWFLPYLWTVLPRLPGKSFALKLAEAFKGLARRPVRMFGILGASTAIQFGLVAISYKLATAAGADIEPGHWLFAWPLAKLVAVLPVSLNGLGVREATLAGILAPVRGDTAVIVAAGLVWQAVIFAAGIVGGIVMLLSRGQAQRIVRETAAAREPGKAP